MELGKNRKVRVEVWLSGGEGPSATLDYELPFDVEPKVGDVVLLGNWGFQMTHREFEQDGALFTSWLLLRHDVGTVKQVEEIADALDRLYGKTTDDIN